MFRGCQSQRIGSRCHNGLPCDGTAFEPTIGTLNADTIATESKTEMSDAYEIKPIYKRVLLKLSGESFCREGESGISMSAVSTAAAMFMTPFNFGFWGAMVPGADTILAEISVTFWQMAQTIFILMLIPLVIGMFIRHRFTPLAEKLVQPMKTFSMIFFLVFVALALAGNWENFMGSISIVFFAVLLMNAFAILLGYFSATAFRLPESDRRAVALEVGIQNSGLGLILIFNFFGGLGGMAIIAGWWGIWHIITGYAIGYIWSRVDPNGDTIGHLSDESSGLQT